jgi:predicted nucleotidyltransferase
VAEALARLREEFVFVGGCATGLLLTDPAASPVRATQDVDVIVEVTSLASYHALERELEKSGFKHDRRPEAPVCRWMIGNCILDVMPTDEKILGFGNRWYPAAIRTAARVQLPSGRLISLIAPPAFVATKLEAFHGRGKGEYLSSHDLEDIITVVDGRSELVEEVHKSDPELRDYLAKEFGSLLSNAEFVEALAGHLPGDEASQQRLPMVRERLKALAARV